MKKVVVVRIVSMILCGVCCGSADDLQALQAQRKRISEMRKADESAGARKLARPLVIKIASCSKQIDCLLSQ